MKRFITYLYLYENGVKLSNVGFARVDIRDQNANIEISLRNLKSFQENGKICALVNHDELAGVELGEMRIFNGLGSKTVTIETVDIMGSGHSMDDVVGMSIQFGNKGYVASCWDDNYADAISAGSISIQPWIPPQLDKMEPEVIDVKVQDMRGVAKVNVEESINEELQETMTPLPTGVTTYRKIDINQIHSLPSKNWHLCNNSFLLHGFWNYGYLVLKKDVEETKETLSLGIPGIFEKPEWLMAVLFGFPEFSALPSEMKDIEKDVEKEYSRKEENQEPKTGDFGCWFVNL